MGEMLAVADETGGYLFDDFDKDELRYEHYEVFEEPPSWSCCRGLGYVTPKPGRSRWVPCPCSYVKPRVERRREGRRIRQFRRDVAAGRIVLATEGPF